MGQNLVGDAACQEKGLCGCFAQDLDTSGEVSTPAYPGKTAPGTNSVPSIVPSSASYPANDNAAWQAPNMASTPPSAPVPTGPTAPVSFDFILSDLEGAETVAYGEAFSVCTGGSSSAQMDNTSLREFIMTNSSIAPDDLDPHLLQVANDETALTKDGFLHVLREGAVSDTATIEQFLGMASNGETVAAEECRSGLLLFSQRQLGCNFSEEKWDRIFNTVMWDADVTVSMEKWIYYCKYVARIVRLATYCRA